MNVGFTGTHKGMSDKQKSQLESALLNLSIQDFHHGDCIGADEEAQRIVGGVVDKIVIHPPLNTSKRAWCRGNVTLHSRDYIERNHDIVDSCDLLIAAPESDREVLRSGIWATVRYARKKGIPIMLLLR